MISRSRFAPILGLLTTLALLFSMASAAGAAAPELKLSSRFPDYMDPSEPGGAGFISIRNTSAGPLSGNLTVTVTAPPEMSGFSLSPNGSPGATCTPNGAVTECTIEAAGTPVDRALSYYFFFEVDPTAQGTLSGQIEVSGGGTAADLTEPFSLTIGEIGPFAVKAFEPKLLDTEDQAATQAGGHPAAIDTAVDFLSANRNNFGIVSENTTVAAPPENFRNIIAHTPPGLVGYPTATAEKCTSAQLALADHEPGRRVPLCPRDSQVGLIQLFNGDLAPIFNMLPPPGVPAMFGFNYLGVTVVLQARLRPSDYGVDIAASKSTSSFPIAHLETEFWGSPADSSHDRLRPKCMIANYGNDGNVCPTDAPQRAFLRAPTSCTGELPWSVDVDTYQQPGNYRHKESTSPGMGQCDNVPFEPQMTLAPTQSGASATTGLEVGLELPQSTDPASIASADVRSVSVALPEGMAINAAISDGLDACTDAQLGLGQASPAQCPEASRIGTLDLQTPVLDHPLTGSVFLRSQASQDPASGDLYRLALEIRSDEDGVDVKLPGKIIADPDTGQLTTVFSDLPQLPFESVSLHLKSGPRAPLSLPPTCATYHAHAVLEGWNGKTETLDPSFKVDKDCDPVPFKPGFSAGTQSARAGAYSPFALRVTRDPRMPNVSRIDATLPEGELAKLAGVSICPEADAPTGACPPSSEIGKVTAAVGEGPAPLFLPERGKAPTALYLAGPYKGAPYSLLAKVPVQTGPFDLGTVAVRSALRLDPETTRASVLSDPLPQIYAGAPVPYRDIRVAADRPNFSLNPTDCEPMAATGTITSAQGQGAALSNRFQASDCALLGFKPKLSLTLKGEVSRSSHPRLITTLRARKGDANIARARVKLPPSAFLDQSHIGTVCTRVQFAAHSCPARSVYGKASATSPLLDFPLKGKVYLRSSSHQLPDLVVELKGPNTTPIEVALAGKTDSVKGALRSTFEAVPDAPVKSFRLELFGGKRGLIEMSSGFCANPKAAMRFEAQNGKALEATPEVSAKDCTARGKRRAHRDSGK